MIRAFALLLALVVVLGGCVNPTAPNPSFPLSMEDADEAFESMKAEKKPLERPLLIYGGYGDPGLMVGGLANRMRLVTSTPDLVVSRDFFWASSIPQAREWAYQQALETYADGDEDRLREMEFDVIGFSMGGLVARAVAAPPGPSGTVPALNVRRMYTIGTPHRGAKGATLPSLDPKVRAMRPGSPFLARLDEALNDASYELVCYVRLGDGIVGQENTAPEGVGLYWVPNQPFEFAHLNAGSDMRIIVDIARRLRGETPFTTEDAAPLPVDD